MGNIRTITVYGKVLTAVASFYLVSTESTQKHVPCEMNGGYYPAPVTADFTNIQHIVVRFSKPQSIQVDLERITA